MSIKTPNNQIKLTNVSIVRLKKAGKRFEIACYKNKVVEFRKGIETRMDEVLQSNSIFVNVSKGQIAKKEDIQAAFPNLPPDQVLLEILKKGELQVGEKERQLENNNTLKDVANIVAEKCINPETKRPYPVTMIEKAMKDIHFSLKPNKSAKQQALEVIRLLKESNVIPITRAQMRIRVSLQASNTKTIEKIKSLTASAEEENWGDKQYDAVLLIDPGNYRLIEEALTVDTKGKGILEVLNLKETKEGEEQMK